MYVVTWCQDLHIDAELRTCINALESPSPLPPPPPRGRAGGGGNFLNQHLRFPVRKPDPVNGHIPVKGK